MIKFSLRAFLLASILFFTQAEITYKGETTVWIQVGRVAILTGLAYPLLTNFDRFD